MDGKALPTNFSCDLGTSEGYLQDKTVNVVPSKITISDFKLMIPKKNTP